MQTCPLEFGAKFEIANGTELGRKIYTKLVKMGVI